MIVKQLAEQHLEFLSLKGGCTCSSESTLFKMSHCWKSRVAVQMILTVYQFKCNVSGQMEEFIILAHQIGVSTVLPL